MGVFPLFKKTCSSIMQDTYQLTEWRLIVTAAWLDDFTEISDCPLGTHTLISYDSSDYAYSKMVFFWLLLRNASEIIVELTEIYLAIPFEWYIERRRTAVRCVCVWIIIWNINVGCSVAFNDAAFLNWTLTSIRKQSDKKVNNIYIT